MKALRFSLLSILLVAANLPAGVSQVRADPAGETSLWLPVMTNCHPAIVFTHVPPYGSLTENLEGKIADCAGDPAELGVAVYIYVSGWWTKPYFASPVTTIQPDRTWSVDVVTGGSDQLATRMAAFLIPKDYAPPLLSGSQAFPEELLANSRAHVIAERQEVYRTVQFSGHTWRVKAVETLTGPGPNYFSGRPEDVWVDENGRLHLTITFRDGRWYCSEVITNDTIAYGTYVWTLAGRVDQLDKNIVLGLFTWDDLSPQYNYREIDIEFSRWSEDAGQNAQFVVQPWDVAGNRHRFDLSLTDAASIHGFIWGAGEIDFLSGRGRTYPPTGSDLVESWQYTGAHVPPPGTGNIRINLWLNGGNPPSNGQGAEVIIEAFKYTP